MSSFRPELTPEVFNARSAGHLPGRVGLRILTMTPQGVASRLKVRREVQVDMPGAAVFQSFPMKLWFFGYFFFPRPLAEGNG
jgi:hypothetical protein